MATFADTILQVIFNYRQLLKRHFKADERRAKLRKLGLHVAIDPTDEQGLYKIGQQILAELKQYSSSPNSGYYSYSGLHKFIEHLENLLDQHEIQNDQVIHRGQKASRALLHVIQVLAHPKTKHDESLYVKLTEHAQVIANHGSMETHNRYREALQKFLECNELFFKQLLQEFEQAL